MTLPVVDLTKGKVSWTQVTTDANGNPLSAANGDLVTGYLVGLRSLTAAGSAVGVYPIQSPVADPNTLTDALSAITANLKADDYAASVQALSSNGPSRWADEFQFTGVLPVPNAPTGVTVA